MTDLQVPSRFRLPLIHVANLTDQAVNELCAVLESNPKIVTSRDAVYEFANKLPNFDDAGEILEAIIPLLFYKASRGTPTKEVVKEVVGALKSGDKQAEKLRPEQVQQFERNITRFLDISGVTLLAKALSLATDCARLFTETKIISDLRPVFGADVSSPPLGATIIHSLKVAYAENGEEKEFFVQMDGEDLQSLRDWVNRALDKQSSLESFLRQSKLKYFETSL